MHLLAFLVTATVVVVVPGPGVLFAVGRALAYGRRTSLSSVVGGAVAELVMVVVVALGLGALVERSMVVFSVIKFAGAAYLVYLGIRAWRDRHALALGQAGGRAKGFWAAARDGFLVSVSNPKTVVFLVAVLPQFIDAGQGHVPAQLLLLGAIFTVISVVSDSMWCLLAGGVRTWFGRSPRRLAAIGGAGGIAMIGLGVGAAASGRPD